jgi:two-component system, sensor histidine kinase and response regulator
MKKILIVDDNSLLRMEICDILKMEKFEVLEASDGVEALEMAKKELPNLIISDIMMPVLDGFQLYDELNKNPLTQDIPFIFISALADKVYVRRGMNLGADDYLVKPVSAENLAATVKKRIEKSEKHQSRLDQLRKSVSYFLPNELRTPLNGIIGFSEYLLGMISDVPETEIIEVLENILHSAKRLERITENYMVYSRLVLQANNHKPLKDLSKEPLIETKNSIEGIVKKIGTENHRLIDITIELVDAQIRIYKEYFDKIVEELVQNAIKFSIPGNKIKIISGQKDGKYCLSVENEGYGLSTEQIADIGAFIQFERMEYEQQGVGLGLAIVKKISEIYKASFEIKSEPGKFLICSICFDLK